MSERKTNFEQAAADLEAAASAMSPYLERIDGLITLMDANDGCMPPNLPPKFLISLDDTFAVHQAGERAFLRHLAIYPDLRDEWIPATRQQWSMTLAKGHRAVLGEKMGVLRHCASIARLKAGLSSVKESQPSYYYFGDVHMGDKYSAAQAGAMGPQAHAHDMNFNQVSAHHLGDLDMHSLAVELASLRCEMRKTATEPAEDITIGQIAAAEAAAQKGDASGVMRHLKSAGKWAFDVASKIGVSVASEAIKKSIGL